MKTNEFLNMFLESPSDKEQSVMLIKELHKQLIMCYDVFESIRSSENSNEDDRQLCSVMMEKLKHFGIGE